MWNVCSNSCSTENNGLKPPLLCVGKLGESLYCFCIGKNKSETKPLSQQTLIFTTRFSNTSDASVTGTLTSYSRFPGFHQEVKRESLWPGCHTGHDDGGW